MNINAISYDIRGAVFKVYNELGPGLLESVYGTALIKELYLMGYKTQGQKNVAVEYKGEYIDKGFRVDILVENTVLVEIKSVGTLKKVHFKQVLTYLRLSDLKLGIMINFNSKNISKSIFRIVNDL